MLHRLTRVQGSGGKRHLGAGGLEIAQRARLGLQRREVIVPESIEVEVSFSDDVFRLWCSFRFTDEESPRELNVVVSAVDVEVITV